MGARRAAWRPSGTLPKPSETLSNQAPTSTTRPSTMREAGEARSSRAPCSVASVRNAAAVSKLIFRNGERLQSMPARLHARYPPWPERCAWVLDRREVVVTFLQKD